jgi:hypothetical protein
VDSISIAARPTKSSYAIEEAFSAAGLALNVLYSDGSTNRINTGWTLTWNGAPLAEGSAAITDSTGNKTVIVAYEGQTVSFTISVSNAIHTISGTITTSDGAGASGASVQLNRDGSPLGSAVSAGANGAYTISGVSAGTYTIDVSLAGYVTGTITGFTVSGANVSGKDLVLQKTNSGDIAGTTITIANTANWTDTLARISAESDGTSSDPKVYTLDIQGDVSVPGTESSENTISGNYKTVRLTGSGTLSLASSSPNSSRSSIFRLGNSNQTLIIDGPTLSSGDDGLNVYAGDGTVELWNGTISGSGVSVGSGTFTMNGGAISDNSSSGVSVSSGTFTMNGGTISGNRGGVYVDSDGSFTMLGGTISGNTAAVSGSGSSSSSYFDRYAQGGGVYVYSDGTFTMLGGTISDNTIASTSVNYNSVYGGGVYVDSGGIFTMSGGTISGNTISISASNSSYYGDIDSRGGGVYVADNGTFTMNEGAISGNTATATSSHSDVDASSYGGGVYVASDGTFTMSGGDVSGNTATIAYATTAFSYGGGVYAGSGTFTMTGGTINSNTATITSARSAFSYGGGVYAGDGTFTMMGGIISDNTATSNGVNSPNSSGASSYGGGVCVVGGTFTMNEGTISDNTAVSFDSLLAVSVSAYSYGGGVATTNGTFTMNKGTISGNTAMNGGGVYVEESYLKTRFFTKTGGTIYGDTDHIVGNGNATDNTAIVTANSGNGHAVLYGEHRYTTDITGRYLCTYYYRNETLEDDENGNISTLDALPATSGTVLNGWTRR